MSAGLTATGSLSATDQALIYPTAVGATPDGPLEIDANAFATRYIEQEFSKPATVNTLSVTLQPNFAVPQNTLISIFNLRGASPVGNAALVQLQPSSIPLGNTGAAGMGKWLTQEEGIQVRTREALTAGEDLVFSFQVVNPTEKQASPAVSLQTRVPFLGPQRLMLHGDVSGSVLSSDDFMFVEAAIQQSSCFPGATNTITAHFSINFDVLHSDHDLSELVLSISGLRNRSAAAHSSSAAIPVDTRWSATSGVQAEEQFMRMGNWTVQQGLMELRPSMHATGILSDVTYSVSWNVHNPFHAQEPPPQSGVVVRLSYQGSSAWELSKVMAMSKQRLSFTGSEIGDAEPLRVYEPRFFRPSAAQSSPWPSAQNTITLTMTASVNISFPTQVTISGLTGTGTASPNVGLTLLDTSSGTSPFEDNAEWKQETGTLVLKMKVCEPQEEGPPFKPRKCHNLAAGVHQVDDFSLQ